MLTRFVSPIPSSIAALSYLVAAPGCAGDSGAADQAQFGGECDPGDLACENAGLDAPLAVGASLPIHVDLETPGAATPNIELIAADPGVIKVSGFELRGEAPGMSAVLAVTDDDLVLDLIHVYVATPNRIEIRRMDHAESATIDGRLQLLVGDELPLALSAYADGAHLSGRAEGGWSSSSEAVALLYDGTPGSRRLVARQPGAAEIVVAALGKETQLTVEVLE